MEAKLGCGELEKEGEREGRGQSEVRGSHQEAQKTAGSSQSQTARFPTCLYLPHSSNQQAGFLDSSKKKAGVPGHHFEGKGLVRSSL